MNERTSGPVNKINGGLLNSPPTPGGLRDLSQLSPTSRQTIDDLVYQQAMEIMNNN